ncbi:hypothetical protein ACHEXK_08680 [Limnohabitans sp. DCL3]|uniref:hypothetical protein n=1 Tax=Limnohabitans sp. DCL3 TaxID=3374103 RepID=UPI003A8C732E
MVFFTSSYIKLLFAASLAWVLLFLLATPAHSQTNLVLDDALKASIRGRALLKEKCDVRTVAPKDWVKVDIDGDGYLEIIAPFITEGCGGGNNWGVSIGVFRKTGSLFRMVDSQPIQGILEKITVSVPRIVAQTLVYGAEDPRCCPSQKSFEIFIWVSGALRASST